MAYVITDECKLPEHALANAQLKLFPKVMTNALSTLIHALTAEHALVFVQQKLSLKANIF